MIITAPARGSDGESIPDNKPRSFSKEEIDILTKALVEIAFYQANSRLLEAEKIDHGNLA